MNKKDGIVFKVLTDGIRIRRDMEWEYIQIGDIVAVSFVDAVDVEAGNVVKNALSIHKGSLVDGDVAVPE